MTLLALELLLWAGSATAQTAADEKVLDLAATIERRVAKLRGHAFSHEVTKGIFTRQQLMDFVLESLDEEMPAEEADAYGKALKIFGFIPPDMDLRETLAGFLTLQIGGFYDPKTKILRCISSDIEFLQHIVMVHEIEHALQDQQFDLMRHTRLMDDLTDHDEDLQRAIQAVVEGDAQYVSELYPTRFSGAIELGVDQANAKAYGRFAIDQLVALSAAPPYLTETMTFPYMSGSKFIDDLRDAGGWDLVDAAFLKPPLSTEQVLHPRKFLEGNDPPLAIQTADLTGALRDSGSGESTHRIVSNTMGEFGVRTWLRLVGRDMVRSLRAAPGWGGDRYDVYEDPQDGRLVLAWFTVWDTEKDAREFLDGARVTLGRRRGGQGTDADVGKRGDGFYVRTTKSLGFGERDAKRVLVVDGLDPRADLDAIAQAAWQGRVVGPKPAVDVAAEGAGPDESSEQEPGRHGSGDQGRPEPGGGGLP